MKRIICHINFDWWVKDNGKYIDCANLFDAISEWFNRTFKR